MAKRCTSCLQWKENTEFYRDCTKLDGLKSQCKGCRKLYKREYRARLRQRKQAQLRRIYMQAWIAKPKPKKKINQTSGYLRWREKTKARRRAYISEHLRQWHISNSSLSKTWYQSRPAEATTNRQAQRSKTMAIVINTLSPEEWTWLQNAYGQQCAYCGVSASEKKLTPDHIIPLSQGGHNTLSNIVPACPSCNSQKGARTPEESAMNFVVQVDVMDQMQQLSLI